MYLKSFLLLLSTLFWTCTVYRTSLQKNDLKNYLYAQPILKNVLDSFEQYQSQVLYIRIDRDKFNKPIFNQYSINLQPDHYFYPASMVKMPLALLAAEKINLMSKTKPAVHLHTPIKFDAGHPPQTGMSNDSTAWNKLPSIGHFIKKIFVVSDNEAYNRLYEFVGQEQINQRLMELGYVQTAIVHRLDAPDFDVESNKYTNPWELYDEDQSYFKETEKFNTSLLKFPAVKNTRKGQGFISNDSLVNRPFDFSTKNHFSILDMTQMIQRIIFPESVPDALRFSISEEQRRFILTQMSKLPRESQYPKYDSSHVDGYCKFLMYGDSKDTIPSNIRIFNKVGWAYGFLTDAAYIVDFKHGVEFIVAATIHVNADGIYNDGQYEYESIGLPFLGTLGRQLYQYELKRKKKKLPEIQSLKLNYTE